MRSPPSVFARPSLGARALMGVVAPLGMVALLGASALMPASALAQTDRPSAAAPAPSPGDTSPGVASSATEPSAPSETDTSPPSRRSGRDDDRRSPSGRQWGGWDREDGSGDRMRPGGGMNDGPDGRASGPRERMMGAPHGMGMRMGGGAYMRHHMRHGMMMGRTGMGHADGGARLDFKRGDASIRIRCPADEPIAACVDAVTKLVDKLQSLHQTRAP